MEKELHLPMCFRINSAIFFVCIVGGTALDALGATPEGPNFVKEVAPILSSKCFVCHGPDAEDEDFLRLDSAEAATRDLGGYQALDPGNPEESEILARIFDESDPMPPEDAEKGLTDSERETLRRWVLSGGEYQIHWSFVPPTRPETPSVRRSDLGPIDQFVFRQLSEEGTEFAPRADKATLARRAALTLIGLPPEEEMLGRFLADERPDAYERFVDELLSDPRFGEHQARYWLDAVRYGDTHGLHLDNRRGIYPYRDWVVRALNDNLPMDQFITWQLAGDLLEEPSMDQLTATGFVRMNPTTSEGGVLPEEFQAKNNFDRVETVGTVFLGMTFTCARCHNHKYDPLTQEDYYGLFAFFNNTAESPLDGNAYAYGPTIRTPENPESRTRWFSLVGERDQLLKTAGESVAGLQDQAIDYAEAASRWAVENSKWIQSSVGSNPFIDDTVGSGLEGLPGETALDLPGEDDDPLWATFEVHSPVTRSFRMRVSGPESIQVWVAGQTVERSDRWASRGHHWFDFEVTEGATPVVVRAPGSKLDGKFDISFDRYWREFAEDDQWSRLSEADRLLTLGDPNGPFAGVVGSARAWGLLEDIERERADFTTTLVARELDSPRETRVLRRGEYNLPVGDPLAPSTPESLSPFPESAPRNRLGLAQWLLDEEQPLLTRVWINRIWGRVFGAGLVRSPEDFGRQGRLPTHPELLDWLSVEFRESGWDLKAMLRRIVTSVTFCQESVARPELKDPENTLLGRGPNYRLDAEVIRDVGLWASGLLSPVMGGEGVKPYQPEGMWQAMAHPASNTKLYVRDEGRRLYRRSLYVYWKRTSPHPMMTLFDAPSRESSCVMRSRTNTPFQSLAMLNETQRVEMGRMLAERLLTLETDDSRRFDQLFTWVASRPPVPEERQACEELVRRARERYGEDMEAAKRLLSVGDARNNEALRADELAAWTQLAMVVLASDVSILLY